jgi:hypothetical protein
LDATLVGHINFGNNAAASKVITNGSHGFSVAGNSRGSFVGVGNRIVIVSSRCSVVVGVSVARSVSRFGWDAGLG